MLTVAIASSDMTSSAQLVAALQQTGLVKSIKQWSIPSDKLPDSSETPPDVVLLDLARDPEHFFSFAAHVRRIHPVVKLVAISAVVPPGHQLLLEAMRSGDQPIPESMADALGKGDVTIDEFVEICQAAMENLAGQKATTLAAVMRDAEGGQGTTDYVEMIKRMAAQGREPPGIERG